MKNQTNQFLVRLNNKEEGDNFIKQLEENGFINLQEASFDDLQLKILIVNLKNYRFWGANITCLAAGASLGVKPISVDEFLSINNLTTDIEP